MKVIIYTDGASKGNPGKGGFGAVLIFGKHRKEISKGYKLTTNNRMELLAVIESIKCLKNKTIPIEIYTDSKYVSDTINKKWLDKWKTKQFKNVKNPDLWKDFVTVSKGMDITFFWVKGHAGNIENERCDELANIGCKNPTSRDIYFENSR